MSDAVQIALIVAVPPVVIGVLNYLAGQKRDKVLRDVHTLVNSQMGEQLLIGMVAARTLADREETPENQVLAAAAEEKYRQHQERQARVDGKTQTT